VDILLVVLVWTFATLNVPVAKTMSAVRQEAR